MRNVEILNCEPEGSERSVIAIERGETEDGHPTMIVHVIEPGRSAKIGVRSGVELSLSDSMPSAAPLEDGPSAPDASEQQVELNSISTFLDEVAPGAREEDWSVFQTVAFVVNNGDVAIKALKNEVADLEAKIATLTALADLAVPLDALPSLDHAPRDETPVTEDSEVMVIPPENEPTVVADALMSTDGLEDIVDGSAPLVSGALGSVDGVQIVSHTPAAEPELDPIDGQSDIVAGEPHTGSIVQ